jgi:hypothetical protein
MAKIGFFILKIMLFYITCASVSTIINCIFPLFLSIFVPEKFVFSVVSTRAAIYNCIIFVYNICDWENFSNFAARTVQGRFSFATAK